MRIYQQRGDEASARAAQQLLDKAWMGELRTLNLARLRREAAIGGASADPRGRPLQVGRYLVNSMAVNIILWGRWSISILISSGVGNCDVAGGQNGLIRV
jgi:hypothetical protein